MIRLLRIKLFINFNENPRPQYINELMKNGKTESSSFLEKNLKDCLFILFLENIKCQMLFCPFNGLVSL